RIAQAALGYGTKTLALRASGTYRNAGSFHDGNGSRIGGSGYQKSNFMTSVVYRPADGHELNLRYIGDLARKIGYPNLLMDTRKAHAHIAGSAHTWNVPGKRSMTLKTDAYLNRVTHWMDDYDRDVADREVMGGMFMP